MPKINFIIHFFFETYMLKIAEFDWPTAFWPITQEPEFFEIRDWW